MPAVGAALGALIMTNINTHMKAIRGTGPLEQPMNPSYYITMCTAIGIGIAKGSPVINFTTIDSGFMGAPPVPAIMGMGVGIVVDQHYLEVEIYTRIRAKILATFGKSLHEPYPPSKENSGKYLEAVAKGIAQSVGTHYATAWTLTSAHPLIYSGSGTVSNGMFSGLSPSMVSGLILSNSSSLKGQFWPIMAQTIAECYVDAIHLKSTGTVVITGVCVPAIPFQLCDIPGVGAGTGVAS